MGVLVANGNQVTIEHKAGERSHYSDKDYSEAGAQIVYDRTERSQMAVKQGKFTEEQFIKPYQDILEQWAENYNVERNAA